MTRTPTTIPITDRRRHSARQTANQQKQEAKRQAAATAAAARTTPQPPRLAPPPPPPPTASAATIPEALMPAFEDTGADALRQRVAADVAARKPPTAEDRACKHTTKKQMVRMLKAAWAEVIGRRKETRALRAAVASLSKEVEALRTAAAAATAATTAAATITHGPDGLFPLDEDAARAAATASPSAWAPGSAGAVDVDAFVAKPTPNKAGSGDLNAFLDVFMKEGWGEEQMALIDAAAAAAAVAPLMGPSAR